MPCQAVGRDISSKPCAPLTSYGAPGIVRYVTALRCCVHLLIKSPVMSDCVYRFNMSPVFGGNRPRRVRRAGRPLRFWRRTRTSCVPGKPVVQAINQHNISCPSTHTLTAFSVVHGICRKQTVFLPSCGASCQPGCVLLACLLRLTCTIQDLRRKNAVQCFLSVQSFQERLRTPLRMSGDRRRRLPRAGPLLSAV